MTNTGLPQFLRPYPLIAILRGVQTHECLGIVAALYEAGLRCIEVPLNSPDALASIALLAHQAPADCLIGAGTVLSSATLGAVADAGGKLIVMPHCDTHLIAHGHALGLVTVPGVATLSEAFTALQHGADALKLFPAECVPPSTLKHWRTVLPDSALCVPVGGIKPEQMARYFQAGANGFGLGAALYQPGMNAEQVKQRAREFIARLES